MLFHLNAHLFHLTSQHFISHTPGGKPTAKRSLEGAAARLVAFGPQFLVEPEMDDPDPKTPEDTKQDAEMNADGDVEMEDASTIKFNEDA